MRCFRSSSELACPDLVEGHGLVMSREGRAIHVSCRALNSAKGVAVHRHD